MNVYLLDDERVVQTHEQMRCRVAYCSVEMSNSKNENEIKKENDSDLPK